MARLEVIQHHIVSTKGVSGKVGKNSGDVDGSNIYKHRKIIEADGRIA